MSELALVAALSPEEARSLTDEVKRDAEALWRKLVRLYEGGAHTALEYKSWGAYFEAEFKSIGSARHGYRLLDAGRALEMVSDQLVTPANEAQARELAPLLPEPEELREAWAEVVELHPDPTAADVREVVRKRKTPPAVVVAPPPPAASYATVVVDPPWRYDNRATRGAAEDHYATMSIDELLALPVPAAANAHLYLWVTNGMLREGFQLCEAWGFVYKALLTWVKPQIGLGNYFRNATEHVIFGLRGKLPTNGSTIPTWFRADRTQHSRKPDAFYGLVEKASPGPYLEMFARRRRMNWDAWGDEA